MWWVRIRDRACVEGRRGVDGEGEGWEGWGREEVEGWEGWEKEGVEEVEEVEEWGKEG